MVTEETQEKVRENRLRRMAERQGFRLVKSKTRDPRAIGFGGWIVVNSATNIVEAGGNLFLSIDEVEEFLTQEPVYRRDPVHGEATRDYPVDPLAMATSRSLERQYGSVAHADGEFWKVDEGKVQRIPDD